MVYKKFPKPNAARPNSIYDWKVESWSTNFSQGNTGCNGQ